MSKAKSKSQAERVQAQSEEKASPEKLTEREQDILSRHIAKAEKCKARKEPIPDYVKETIEHYGGELP